MFIRNISILTILSIAFFGLAGFFMTINSPFNNQKLQEYAIEQEIEEDNFDGLLTEIDSLIEKGIILEYLSTNALVALFLIIIAVTFLVASMHYFLDKLFFKEFYENASIFDAIRRGFVVSALISVSFYLRLINGRPEEILLSLFIIILIEFLFSVVLKKPILEVLQNLKKKKLPKNS